MKILTTILILLALHHHNGKGVDPNLVWDSNPPSDQVTSYNVYELRPSGPVLLANVPTPSFAILLTRKAHTYAVTALNATGESALSASLTVRR